ncbi:MAG TPA: hypothetical protein VFN75_10980, partial [Pseudonocardiaceae bacterium]|nr:hypothetical protein [Pseudonocardiaceae bacterium]
MPHHHDASDAGPGADPTQRRQQGLRRVGAATKWTVAAAAAGSAVLGMTYAQLLPGAPAPGPAALSAPATAPPSGPACVPTSTAAAALPISSPTSASEEN